MQPFLYATGNISKFRHAQTICDKYGVKLLQKPLGVTEIQAEDATIIAQDKAEKGFKLFGRPLVVSDDSWYIPGLNGFPGPYMRYINHWFRSEDWLYLTRPLKDRRIVLRQIIAYQDEHVQKLFESDIEGIILTESRGDSPGQPHDTVTSFDNGQHSLAEVPSSRQIIETAHRSAWHDFAEWYRDSYTPLRSTMM